MSAAGVPRGYEPLKELFASASLSVSDEGYSPRDDDSPRRPPSSQAWSYRLSGRELKELYNPRGHMPQITFGPPSPEREEAARRIAALDAALQDRVQGICERLSGAQEQLSSASRCAHRVRGLCTRYVRLGVVGQILPHIAFYVVYSLGVTYYAQTVDWEVRWTLTKQDAIYYPAVVLSFLLCFRASGCMDRYNDGLRTVFEMEKCLREVAFEVMTRLSVDDEGEPLVPGTAGDAELRDLRKRYFKHEFRRTVRLLFACAARDLNDSALGDGELDEDEAMALECAMTKVEHAAVLVTHSAFGHAFRVYLACAWLLKLVRGVDEDHLFDGEELEVYRIAEVKLMGFKHAWLEARQVAYTAMPGSVTHILWLLTTVMSLFMPWEWVTVCQWSTWFPSVLLTISFYGIMEIANAMENPFGFDVDDIPVAKVAQHLDEEVCLTMHYAMLDEFGGENLYRSLMGTPMIFLDEVGLPGSEGLSFLVATGASSPSGRASALRAAQAAEPAPREGGN